MRKNGKTFFTTENANGDEVLNFLCGLSGLGFRDAYLEFPRLAYANIYFVLC